MPRTKRGHHRTKASGKPKSKFMYRHPKPERYHPANTKVYARDPGLILNPVIQ
jgi:hypothetical protein